MKPKLLLILIFSIAICFRFNNLNWDSNYHLHPDERFLTMVGGAMKIPPNLKAYLDPKVSLMNPANIGHKFYVYGTLPLTLNKVTAVLYNNDNYNMFTIQGRVLSALFDLLTLFLVYKTIELLEKKYKLQSSLKYWASFFYAIAVLPIQLAHFFTVDTFLNFFVFASFYFSLRFYIKRGKGNLILSAVFFGLALATKVNAVFILPLNLLIIIYDKLNRSGKNVKDKVLAGIGDLFRFFIIAYFILRLADPYIFESGNFFDLRLSKLFIDNLKLLKSWEGRDIWYPPGIQWISKKPIIHSAVNLAFFGLGLPYFTFMLLGIFYIAKIFFIHFKHFTFHVSRFMFIFLLWTLVFFFYQSAQFAQVMRYFIIIYPFLAIFAGHGVSFLLNPNVKNKKPFDIWILDLLVILLLILWPLAFSSIYLNKHSRVAASDWIYKNLKNNSLILAEYWDDALPLPVEETYGKTFRVEFLPVFDQDSDEKWQKMNELLKRADYYILSSNRGWGSIPTVPEKYPQMTKFYQDLFADRTSYKKIKEFTAYPSLKYLGIPIEFPDQWSDESFTVYDHPKVMIFSNNSKKD